mmetsp:Transcript_11/g.31  ORF Transcript_11/g.31 Transcript_11/m.31 type:complete len:378 (-) Transcript_11:393-1526(-)
MDQPPPTNYKGIILDMEDKLHAVDARLRLREGELSAVAHLSTWKAHLVKTEEQLQVALEEIQELRKQIAELQQAKHDSVRLHSYNKEVEEGSSTFLRGTLNDALEKNDQLQREVDSLRRMLKEREAAMESSMNRADEYGARFDQLERDNHRLRKELMDAHMENKHRVQQLEQEAARVSTKNKVLKAREHALKRQIKLQTETRHDMEKLCMDLRDMAVRPDTDPMPMRVASLGEDQQDQSYSSTESTGSKDRHNTSLFLKDLLDRSHRKNESKKLNNIESKLGALQDQTVLLHDELHTTQKVLADRLYTQPKVERALDGTLLAKCRNCAQMFDFQHGNKFPECGYHPGNLINGTYTCCGVKCIANVPPTFCSFRKHIA